MRQASFEIYSGNPSELEFSRRVKALDPLSPKFAENLRRLQVEREARTVFIREMFTRLMNNDVDD